MSTTTLTAEPVILQVNRSKRGAIFTEKSGNQTGISRRAIIQAFEEGRRVVLDFSLVRGDVTSERLRKVIAKLRGIAHAKRCENGEIELRGIGKQMVGSVDRAFAKPIAHLRVSEQGVIPADGDTPQTVFVVFAVEPWSRRDAQARILERLIERDGAACAWCSLPLTAHDQDATLDHVLPRSCGGRNSIDNYLLSCSDCNWLRADMPAPKWLKECLSAGKRKPVEPIVQAAFTRVGL